MSDCPPGCRVNVSSVVYVKDASFSARFDMSSRGTKAKTKVQGASIISPLRKPYGKSRLFKVI